jgi:uncharacterized protein (TIGR00297 family)
VLLTLILSFLASAVIVYTAFRLGALSSSGAAAAIVAGGLVLSAGLSWGVLLLAFFASSSLLSVITPAAVDTISARGNARDAAQVLANGGVPALCALLSLLHASSLWEVAFAAALAAATADTWATEIGRMSANPPRDILTHEPVPAGTSGGVTTLGVIASLVGAALIEFTSVLLRLLTVSTGITVLAAGFLGAVADSVLGATVQEVRRCPGCGLETEQLIHRHCDCRTQRVRGIAHLNNDIVNALSTAIAAGLAILSVSL